MDSETRHKLQTNELGEALEHASHIKREHLIMLFGAIGVVLLVALGWRYMSWRAEAVADNRWQAFLAIGSISPQAGDGAVASLESLVQRTPDAEVRALATLRLASATLWRQFEPGAEEALKTRRTELEALAARTDLPDVIMPTVLYKLALVQESLRDFDAARATYARLSDNQSYANSPFALVARNRMENLDEIAKPVDFQEGLPPELLAPTPEIAPTLTPDLSGEVEPAAAPETNEAAPPAENNLADTELEPISEPNAGADAPPETDE